MRLQFQVGVQWQHAAFTGEVSLTINFHSKRVCSIYGFKHELATKCKILLLPGMAPTMFIKPAENSKSQAKVTLQWRVLIIQLK